MSGAERRVRRTGILALVRRYHRMQDERAVFVDFGVLDRLEVEHPAFLRPDDYRARRVGLNGAVDAAHQTAR